METRLRMLIVLAGLPEPTIDHRILDRDGRVLYRFDLSYAELRIVVEYDGRQHRADLDQWDHDTDRQDWFDAHGWLHVAVFSRRHLPRPRQDRPPRGGGAAVAGRRSPGGCRTTGGRTSRGTDARAGHRDRFWRA